MAIKVSLLLYRSVTYNYLENAWYNNKGFARTAWIDRGVYASPYAPKYNPSTLPDNEVILGVTAGSSLMYAHEVGKDDDGSAMPCQITSGDFDITQRTMRGTTSSIPDLRGDGEFIMKIRRFIL